MTAAHEGHINTVRSLLDEPGIDIDAKILEGHTALDLACFEGELEVAKLLVAAGARVNPQASNERGALVSAAIGGHLQVVKYLVEEAGADVRWVDPDGMTALMLAADNDDVGVVRYLLGRSGVEIDAKSVEGKTALDFACGNGYLKAAKQLVAAGARVNPQAGEKGGPLHSAVIEGHLECSSLFKVKAIPNLGREPLRETIRTVPTKS
jgi:ankyrin repeat protein